MLPEKAEELLSELCTDGTTLRKNYEKWRNSTITQTVFELMVHLGTADNAANRIDPVGTGSEQACGRLGFVLGRANAVTEFVTLPEAYAQVDEKNIVETFGER